MPDSSPIVKPMPVSGRPCSRVRASSSRPRASARSCKAGLAGRDCAADSSSTASQRPSSTRPSTVTARSTVWAGSRRPTLGLLA